MNCAFIGSSSKIFIDKIQSTDKNERNSFSLTTNWFFQSFFIQFSLILPVQGHFRFHSNELWFSNERERNTKTKMHFWFSGRSNDRSHCCLGPWKWKRQEWEAARGRQRNEKVDSDAQNTKAKRRKRKCFFEMVFGHKLMQSRVRTCVPHNIRCILLFSFSHCALLPRRSSLFIMFLRFFVFVFRSFFSLFIFNAVATAPSTAYPIVRMTTTEWK